MTKPFVNSVRGRHRSSQHRRGARPPRARRLRFEALEARTLLAGDLSAAIDLGAAAARFEIRWADSAVDLAAVPAAASPASAEGEGEAIWARVRGRIAADVPASPTGPVERTDVDTVQPGDRFLLEVYVQDIRSDDGDNNPTTSKFGVFAAHVDVAYDRHAFVVPSGMANNAEGKPILDMPISFQNPHFLAPLGAGLDLVQYRYSNGPRASRFYPGLINDVGSFLDGTTLIGNYEYFQFDVPFEVQSLIARNDVADVAESSAVRIPVLANDELVTGTRTFSLLPPTARGGESTGTELLVFGDTGFGEVWSFPIGSIVPQDRVEFVSDTVTVVNNGTLQGNTIGLNLSGAAAVPNTGAGILFSAGASGNTVGGSGGAGNTIAWNTSQGVYVVSSNSVRNAVLGNAIYRNGALGIDLSPYGVTANDTDDADTGPNRLQNFPAITSASVSADVLTVYYSVPSSTSNAAYPLTVEFFEADADGQEGQRFLGSVIYATPGAAVAPFLAAGTVAGQRLLATATDADGNTSEFSVSMVIGV